MKLIVIEPGSEPRIVEHDGKVSLEDLKKHLGEDVTVDVVRLGTIPPRGRSCDLWIDDEGLISDAKPNRQLPSGTIICGTMLVCSGDESGESLPLTDAEAEFLLGDIRKRWLALAEDHPKPEPGFTVTTLER